MKTIEELAEIFQDAIHKHDDNYVTWKNFGVESRNDHIIGMRAAINALFASIDGVPSVEETVQEGRERGYQGVRDLMLVFFAKQMAERETKLATEPKTAPAGRLSDEELGEIGARAANKAMVEDSDRSGALTVDEMRRAEYAGDKSGRTAFAAAVAAEVRRETPWGVNGESQEEWMTRQREKVANENADLRAIIEKAIEMVNTPGTTAETLPKDINAKIIQRDEFHDATLKKLDAAKSEIARLIQLDATNRGNLERTHKALVESKLAHKAAQQELKTLRTELAKRDELIERYKPRSVSIQPTKADADHHGRVLLIGPGGVSTQALHTDWRVHSSWTHWLPCRVDAYGLAPSPEEVERREFEVWYNARCADPSQHKTQLREAMFDAWQSARGKGVGE